MKVSKYFEDEEFKCPCCKSIMFCDNLLITLDTIRENLGKPVIITSGYRCPAYNAILKGSVPNSGHTSGEAADIYVKGMSNKKLGAFIKNLYKEGKLPLLRFCYLIKGRTNTAVHVGVDNKKRKNVFGF